MGLDLSKLEKIRHRGSTIIARCPACAEYGNDRKGEHLFIEPGGRFGCVVCSGTDGQEHRQRIFKLIGIKEEIQNGFKVKRQTFDSKENVIQRDILGRLGRVKSTHTRKESDHHL